MPRATNPAAKAQKKRKKRKVRRGGYRLRCRFTPPKHSNPTKDSLWVIDYKNVDLLQKYTTSQGKVFSRKRFGNSAQAQNRLKKMIKLARQMALIPYVTGQ